MPFCLRESMPKASLPYSGWMAGWVQAACLPDCACLPVCLPVSVQSVYICLASQEAGQSGQLQLYTFKDDGCTDKPEKQTSHFSSRLRPGGPSPSSPGLHTAGVWERQHVPFDCRAVTTAVKLSVQSAAQMLLVVGPRARAPSSSLQMLSLTLQGRKQFTVISDCSQAKGSNSKSSPVVHITASILTHATFKASKIQNCSCHKLQSSNALLNHSKGSD